MQTNSSLPCPPTLAGSSETHCSVYSPAWSTHVCRLAEPGPADSALPSHKHYQASLVQSTTRNLAPHLTNNRPGTFNWPCASRIKSVYRNTVFKCNFCTYHWKKWHIETRWTYFFRHPTILDRTSSKCTDNSMPRCWPRLVLNSSFSTVNTLGKLNSWGCPKKTTTTLEHFTPDSPLGMLAVLDAWAWGLHKLHGHNLFSQSRRLKTHPSHYRSINFFFFLMLWV